jgi:hypothetical protein
MKTLRLADVDSTVLLRFLENNFSNALCRLWSSDKTTGGIFLNDVADAELTDLRLLLAYRIPALSMSTIVVECNEETLECSVWVRASSSDLYRDDRTADSILEAIKRFATDKGWNVGERIVRPTGRRCPYCDAIYVYPKAGIVRCHNCDKEFEYRPSDERENSTRTP